MIKHLTTYTETYSDAIVDVGIDNISTAMQARSEYLDWFACKKLKTTDLLFVAILSSSRYNSNWIFWIPIIHY